MTPNILRVWHKSGHRRICPRTAHSIKVMFWACISFERKSELVPISGTLNSQSYIELLNTAFLPWIRRHRFLSRRFQQDNAPSHSAKRTKAYLDLNAINCLPWPANSPDMNPIENLWGILKLAVMRHKIASKSELIEVARQEWNKISQEIVQNCFTSMPTRLEQVTERSGDKCDY
jgi:transposase